MPRFNVTMPQELWDRLGQEAERSAGGNRSFVLRRALERALGSSDDEVPRVGFEQHAAVHEAARPAISPSKLRKFG